MKSKVSICMPTFNRDEYLAEAVQSIINQTYKNWELIIVDDGSTDSTLDLLAYYNQKDPKRIKIIRFVDNVGIAKARNTAIAAATGEYIAVMDSDDIMAPDRLKDAMKVLKKSPVDFVYTDFLQGDENGKVFNGVRPPEHPTKEEYRNNAAIPHVTITARRTCFVDHPYREDFKVNDDAGLLLDWFKAKYRSKLIQKPSVIVRYHKKSTSETQNEAVQKINLELQKEYDAL